ncbi:sigma-70 family RNA polymerase sigma factor [Kineosporia succinea]|uniref:RNA polymerase sigma-70 factor (ECF subfamily) n=1 Tax=Kineosporia succinea TaxID=84632 RepID=A0ABT9PBD2_9ACTN|nr:sigma-70 family RNA polymerase sigma factor [Kineosporia succinea]MDP9830004.1 RNA polymerase sigma-70 factor (ECF subfamily) [Kineosporia succinea]
MTAMITASPTAGSVDGHDALLDALVAEHARALLAYTESLINDHYLAEDIVQETLIRAWRHAGVLDSSKGSVRGWLLTVARNLAIDRVRSASSRHESVGTEHRPEPLPGGVHPDHADQVVATQVTDDLLRHLTPEHRDVIRATCLNGLTAKETALALGIPVGTVKSRRHYALSVLRRRVADAA